MDAKTVLVLGASGGIGGEMLRQLVTQGWNVRAMKRGLGVARRIADRQSTGLPWMGTAGFADD